MKSKKKKKIFIVGGHLTPALSVMELLNQKNWEIVYIGRKHALEGDSAISAEYKIITEKGIRFRNLITGRLQRNLSFDSFISLLKLPIGFVMGLWYLISEQPDAVLSFGGYVSLPVGIATWILRIPLVLHEQTRTLGLANRLLLPFCKALCVSWEDTKNILNNPKTIYTGNPIRKEIFNVSDKLKVEPNQSIIYITGGNLGSHAINNVVSKILPQLLNDYIVVHQCGNSEVYKDYVRFAKIKNNLQNHKNRYFLFSYIDQNLIGWTMQNADLIITRAGANIISELIAIQKPSLLIPLPWSGEGEQKQNAKFIESYGAAVVISQEELSGSFLLDQIQKIFKSKKNIVNNLKKLKNYFVPDAAQKIVTVIESIW